MTEREEADERCRHGGLSLWPFSEEFTVRCWNFLIYIRLSLLFTRQSPSAKFANMEKYSKANSDQT